MDTSTLPAVHVVGDRHGHFWWSCDECSDECHRQPTVAEAYAMACRHADWHGWGHGRVLIGEEAPMT